MTDVTEYGLKLAAGRGRGIGRLLRHAPNALTLTRLAVAPLIAFAALAAPVSPIVPLALFVLAALCDWADGALARRFGLVSRLGTILDPIADKVLVATALLTLIASGSIAGLSVIAAALLIGREIAVAGLREALAQSGHAMPVSDVAKAKTALQMVACGILFLGEVPACDGVGGVGLAALWVACGLSLASGYAYVRANLHRLRIE